MINKINSMEAEKKDILLDKLLSQEAKAIAKIKSDNKYFFKYVNRFKRTSNNSPNILIDKNGDAVSDAKKNC